MSKVNLTIVGKINPNKKNELSEYLEKVEDLSKKSGIKPMHKFHVVKVLIGNYTPSIITIIEFPDMKTLNNLFESEAYKKLLPIREKAFLKLEAYIGE